MGEHKLPLARGGEGDRGGAAEAAAAESDDLADAVARMQHRHSQVKRVNIDLLTRLVRFANHRRCGRHPCWTGG